MKQKIIIFFIIFIIILLSFNLSEKNSIKKIKIFFTIKKK